MIFITEQMRYIQDKDLGFDSEQVLVIPNNTINQTTIFTHYKQVLSEVRDALTVTTADQIFGNQSWLGGTDYNCL